MSQFVETPTRAFTAGAALALFLRVKLTAGKLAAAGSTDHELGTMEKPSFADLDVVAVRLRTAQGTCKMVASEAITAGNAVYAAASGKIAASGTVLIGIALEAATANNDVIEVLRRQETSDSAAAGGTTAAAFIIDSDAATPKLELSGDAAGSGDFKGTIKPPATLTANRVFRIQPDANANLLTDFVQTIEADDSESALNQILPHATKVYVDAVTNDANDFIVLPALADVPIGHTITVIGQAASNFEVRTPAASNEEINSEDCDGTKEYLFTDTHIHIFRKIDDTIGWMGQGFTAIGAVVAAVVPD